MTSDHDRHMLVDGGIMYEKVWRLVVLEAKLVASLGRMRAFCGPLMSDPDALAWVMVEVGKAGFFFVEADEVSDLCLYSEDEQGWLGSGARDAAKRLKDRLLEMRQVAKEIDEATHRRIVGAIPLEAEQVPGRRAAVRALLVGELASDIIAASISYEQELGRVSACIAALLAEQDKA